MEKSVCKHKFTSEKFKRKQPVSAKKSKSPYPANTCNSSWTESDEKVDPSELCYMCGL